MKLRTEMVGGGSGCRNAVLLEGHYDAPMDMWIHGAAHDAAAAHALMLAIRELRAEGRDECFIDSITDRADELLREWGFEG